MHGTADQTQKRQVMPVLYTTGTHYEVGNDIGRTFGAMILNLLSKCEGSINFSCYESSHGRKVYEQTLASVTDNFPQYVDELQGIADGAQVPFYKLFRLHMDDITPCAAVIGPRKSTGCSTVCINYENQQILGHNEDVVKEMVDICYIVSAHIISDKPKGRWGVKEEKFTSLCYAGHLPGYAMSYNHHGLIFSINTLLADVVIAGKTPRYFITRALLAAENFEQAQSILGDEGCGAGNGVSVNMTFLQQEGVRLFHNVEVGPAYESNKSQLSVLTANPGETIAHFNKYLRLKVKEHDDPMVKSSITRRKTYENYEIPRTEDDVIKFLGDESGSVERVYQSEDTLTTTATGIFNCIEKTWSIYTRNPRYNEPLVVLPMLLKMKQSEDVMEKNAY